MTKASKILQEQNALLKGPSNFNYLVNTDVIHDRIHQGVVFESTLLDQALANDAIIALLIRPDASLPMHTRFTIATGGDALVNLYTGATFSAPGTALEAVNRNQISTNTALGLVNANPTIIDAGTELIPGGLFVPGGTGFFTGGSSGDVFQEWILEPGVVYYGTLQNISGVVNPALVQLHFYEPIELLG